MPRTLEKRRHERTRIVLPLDFSAPSSGEFHRGVAMDISVGGMFIETEHAAAFGASVLLRFASPDDRRPLLFPAIVRWTRAGGMGVQFASLGARETHAITELASRAPRQP